MITKKIISALLSLFLLIACNQQDEQNEFSFTQDELDEFELLNQCHCLEYLLIRNYDFVKWESDSAKERYLQEIRGLVFTQFSTLRLHGQYHQQKYDSSFFLQHGSSLYIDKTQLNFQRLDSLYFEPVVQHYFKVQSRTESLPYLGLDYNIYIDCFYTIKQIPLETELEYFMNLNPNYIQLK